MNILITGGCGFIGSNMVERLALEEENIIYVIDNLSSGDINNISELINSKKVIFIKADITEPSIIETIKQIKPDRIYNFACPASPQYYLKNPIETFRASVFGISNLLETIKNTKIRLLQSSTSEVYGDAQICPQKESYWGNVNPIGVRACYDEGKRGAESLICDYKRICDCDVRIVRIFNTYGPKMAIHDGRIISNFVNQCLNNENITIYGDGTQTRSFCYIDDTIDALIKVMESPINYDNPINIGNPNELAVLDIAKKIKELTNSRSDIVFCEKMKDDPQKRRPDISFAINNLKWIPKITLENGLMNTINCFKTKYIQTKKYSLRKESFGGTLFDLKTAKRIYITSEEYEMLKTNLEYTIDSVIYKTNDIIFNEPVTMQTNGFSFADIAYIEVTHSCNLRCKHCLNNSGIESDNHLSFENFKCLIDDFAKEGLQEIRFTGGEPLFYEKILELIKYATSKNIYVSIGTNGTLINEEFAKQLHIAGLKKAIVSIDGTKAANDKTRGKGSYRKAMNAVDLLQKYDIEVRINSVIFKDNMDDIIKFAKQMHKNKTQLFIRRFIESGRACNMSNNMLSKKDYDCVKEALKSELLNGKYVNGHYLRNSEENINNRIQLPFKMHDGCKAGERALIITPEGNVHLCGFLAAQGFPPISNCKNIQNWNDFWRETHKQDALCNLRKKLIEYNKIEGIQQTNCLAYVQNYYNNKE